MKLLKIKKFYKNNDFVIKSIILSLILAGLTLKLFELVGFVK